MSGGIRPEWAVLAIDLRTEADGLRHVARQINSTANKLESLAEWVDKQSRLSTEGRPGSASPSSEKDNGPGR